MNLKFSRVMGCLPAALSAWLICSGVEAGAGPRIVCKTPEFRFGTVANSQTLEHTFLMANEGDAPLQIGNIRGCCGASITMAEKTLQPGSNAELKVSLSLKGRQGEMRKSIYVGSNDPTQPYYQLRFLGAVTADLSVEPPLLDFGRMTESAVTSACVRIVCASNLSLRVTNVVSDAAQFGAHVEPTSSNGVWTIAVRTVPPLSLGVNRGKVTVLTDHPQHGRLEFPVVVVVASDIVTVPQEIVLRESKGTPVPATYSVAIRSRTGKPFKIVEMQAPDTIFQTSYEPLASGGYRVAIGNVMPFEDLDGKELVILTDHETARKISVPFRIGAKTGSGNPQGTEDR